MRLLLTLFPLFICGGMMLVCMLLMGGFGRRSTSNREPAESDVHDEVAALRAEVAQLRRDSATSEPDSTRG